MSDTTHPDFEEDGCRAGEHMTKRWRVAPDGEFVEPGIHIETDEDEAWAICRIDTDLPGDKDGAKVAEYIVNMHNHNLEHRPTT